MSTKFKLYSRDQNVTRGIPAIIHYAGFYDNCTLYVDFEGRSPSKQSTVYVYMYMDRLGGWYKEIMTDNMHILVITLVHVEAIFYSVFRIALLFSLHC
jgi:hypothetical protein